jgi:adenylate cyclase
MRYLKTTLFCLILSFSVFGQNIETLEKERSQARDARTIFLKSLSLADLYHKNQQFGQAEFNAQKALEAASNDAERAFVLPTLARAQVGQGRPEVAAKNFGQAVSFFKKNDANRAYEIAQEWLEVAKITQQKREIKAAEKALADLGSSSSEANKGGIFKNIFGGKRRALETQVVDLNQKITTAKNQAEDLSQKIAIVNSQVDKSQSVITNLSHTNSGLANAVAAQRAAIDQMSAEQARAELRLTQQRILFDSLKYEQALDSAQLLQQETQLATVNAELAQQRAERNLFLSLGALGVLIAVAYFFRSRVLRQHNRILEVKNQIIREEKQRSEELLLNILPFAIAEELKKNGIAEARQYESVSVLFTDFVNFTKIAEKMSPQQLVYDLDYCFKNFDMIIQKNGLEKIKTVGDAYMCAAGLPTPQPDHAQCIVRAALAIQDFLNDWKAERMARNEPYFEARIGIHTGNLVAGVVGSKKFAYDIWGDTVNLAARIESAGTAGRVNISEETYRLVNAHFNCTPRGKILTKNKGELDMFFVEKEI